ncbi:MAG: hypothetical protein KAT16_07015 [Candidatus Heimdallarchaeota archaeon]|nr:hypothetical protein [Candidatus Heimdallarchaeota archaeon]
MNNSRTDAHLDSIANQAMIVSVFRNTDQQRLNLLLSTLGVFSLDETTNFIENIFELVRKGIVYIPEARLEILHDSPELVDIFLITDFDVAMNTLVTELSELRSKMDENEKFDFRILKERLKTISRR